MLAPASKETETFEVLQYGNTVAWSVQLRQFGLCTTGSDCRPPSCAAETVQTVHGRK